MEYGLLSIVWERYIFAISKFSSIEIEGKGGKGELWIEYGLFSVVWETGIWFYFFK